MAFTNFDTKEINCKVVYFGSAGSGKTSNLRSIYGKTSAEMRSGMMEFADPTGPTEFFDFLPLSLGRVRDFHLKLHLFTLPSNPIYESVHGVILKGVDGYVFVADSRIEAMADNLEALMMARKQLSDEGYNPLDLPHVVQYNKRDEDSAVAVDLLRQELNQATAADFEAVATTDQGTMETIHGMAKQIIRKLAP